MYVILTKDLNEEVRELSMFKVVAASLDGNLNERSYQLYEAVNVTEETYLETFNKEQFEKLFIETSEANFEKYKDLVENGNFEDAEDFSYSLIKANNK